MSYMHVCHVSTAWAPSRLHACLTTATNIFFLIDYFRPFPFRILPALPSHLSASRVPIWGMSFLACYAPTFSHSSIISPSIVRFVFFSRRRKS